VDKLDIPQGTLDLMILTILAREPLHGYGISQRLAVLSRDEFHVNPGSLFPSLYRLEQDGKLKAEWRATENNRRAKYYRLTASGRPATAAWTGYSGSLLAVTRVRTAHDAPQSPGVRRALDGPSRSG
jgi:transcriptional regulator